MVADSVIQVIKPGDEQLLQQFLAGAGGSLQSFRYFNSRPLSVIGNHVVTAILLHNNSAVGYGHLDKDGDKVWLGIAVAEDFKGQGLGNKIMAFLIAQAKKNKLPRIYLTVDAANINAIKLYEKFGFVFVKDINEKSIMMENTIVY